MEASHKEGSTRPRRSKPAPATDPLESSFPSLATRYEIELPRFQGRAANLGTIAAQLRLARTKGDAARIAELSPRLARQLELKGIEVGAVLDLLEEAREAGAEDVLPMLVEASRRAGNYQTALEYFGAFISGELSGTSGELPESTFQFLMSGALVAAQLGDAEQAKRSLRLAQRFVERAPDRRLKTYERLGSLGFWTSDKEASTDAYLLAAELGETLGGGTAPLDNALRALELGPNRRDVAEGVARKLLARGRSRAGDAIIRNYVKRVGAAERAAFHQRRFQTELREGNWEAAFAAALDAGLDAELDFETIKAVLTNPPQRPKDFESFLLFLSQKDVLGDREAFGQWLISLIEAHSFLWGEREAHGLRSRALQVLALEAPESITPVGSESRIRELRQRLAGEQDPYLGRELRDQIARLELFRGEFRAAYQVLEPNLEETPESIVEAGLWLFVASRASELGRTRALGAMARKLPEIPGAEMGAVASEGLALLGEGARAIATATEASRRAPTSERALVALANATLSFPEIATPEQIESSVALTVARAETCLGLARSALSRGAVRLALTWSERALSLRPTDADVHRYRLEVASEAADPRRLAEGIWTSVLAYLPHDSIADAIEKGLIRLAELDREQCIWALERVLENTGHVESLERTILVLARQLGAFKVEASAIERSILRRPGENLGPHYVALAEARARGLDFTAALRAFLTGLRQWDIEPEWPEFWPELLAAELDPDAMIAKAEVEVELDLRRGEPIARKFLDLGVMRWDMCEDMEGSLDAFLEAALLAPEDGFGLMAYYLMRLVGAGRTATLLETRASQIGEPKTQGVLLGFAARARLLEGRTLEAFSLAERALLLAPFDTEVLAVVEKVAGQDEVDRLERIYDQLAEAALGRFGERAIRYRAARQMERRAGRERAFRHAKLAFQAVPSDGIAYVLMMRLAASSDEKEQARFAIEKIASEVRDVGERQRWRSRAEMLGQVTPEASEQELDLLFRALQVSVEPSVLVELSSLVARLLPESPEPGVDEGARLALHSQLKARLKESVSILNGPNAPAALCLFSRIAVERLHDSRFGLECVARALEGGLVLPEFATLVELAPSFSVLPEELRELGGRVQKRCAQGEQLGVEVAEFLARCFAALGDGALEAEILVCAATDAPDDQRLVHSAREACVKSGRVDLTEVVEGLLPAQDWARSVLDRVSSLSDASTVDALLAIDTSRVDVALQIEVLEVVAKAEERLGRFADARDSYRALHKLVPKNGIALAGLERVAEREEDFDDLFAILTLRCEAVDELDLRRAIHLRRAAILETHLGRPEEARQLLRQLLLEFGEGWSALRLLADSLERASDFGGAALLWSRAQAVATDIEAALDASFRAASAHLAAGEIELAREALRYVDLNRLECLELKLKVERAASDPAAVMETLLALARRVEQDARRAAGYYLEAAEIGLRLEVYDIAEESADRAAKLAPDLAEARLMACQLEARRSPIASRERGESTLFALAGTETLRGTKHRELRAYLTALARDQVDGFGVGRRELEKSIVELGPRPLLVAALAERLVDDPERALTLYEAAAGGDFLHMLSRGKVLLEAARLARERGQWSRCRAFLSAVAEEDPERTEASNLLETLLIEEAREQAASARISDIPPSLVRSERKPVSVAEREAAQRLAREADAAQRAMAVEKDRLRLASEVPPSGEASVEVSDERELVLAFEQGDLNAGQALFDIYMSERARSRDAMLVAIHLAARRPWDPEHLSYLITAASRDGHEALALAARHVLGAYAGGEPVKAPPLELALSTPEAVQLVLWRGLHSPSLEALGLVWEHATRLFQRELTSYGLDASFRLTAQSEPGLYEFFRNAARLLGVGRVALYRESSSGDIELETLLTLPPSMMVRGAVPELAPGVAFHFGASLAATAPEFALLFGGESATIEAVFEGIALAFGPSRVSSNSVPQGVAELAGLLWETIPPRAQRRLSQLCVSGERMDPAQAFEDARVVLRRAGLLVSGDILTAIDDACLAVDRELPRTLAELADAADALPTVLDLLLLAISTEYAEVRYRIHGSR